MRTPFPCILEPTPSPSKEGNKIEEGTPPWGVHD